MRGLMSTIMLIVVLAGLGAYIYFVDSERPIAGVEEKQKVFTVESDTIEEIRLTADNETTLLRKADDTWRMIEPQQAAVDQNEVTGLTTNLATLEVNRVIEENASDLSKYGLANPRIKVAFKAQGASGEVHIGEKTPTQSDMYAVKPGESRVFLVSAFQETTFAKKPFDLRDKRVLNFDRDKVDLVEINTGSSVIQIARSGSDWTLKQPVQGRVDYSAIEGLLTRLASTNMTKIVDGGTPAEYGLEKPRATITVGAGSARATLAIGNEAEGAAYARDLSRDLIFTVDPALATDLEKPVDDYRDKDLFEARSFNAVRLRITRGSETVEFQKVAGSGENAAEKWQRVNPGGATTDVDAVQMEDFLSKATALRAESFTPSLQGTGLEKPALIVAVSYDGGKFERVVFAKAGADAFAAREGEPGAVKLDTVAFDEVVKTFEAVLAPAKPAA